MIKVERDPNNPFVGFRSANQKLILFNTETGKVTDRRRNWKKAVREFDRSEGFISKAATLTELSIKPLIEVTSVVAGASILIDRSASKGISRAIRGGALALGLWFAAGRLDEMASNKGLKSDASANSKRIKELL